MVAYHQIILSIQYCTPNNPFFWNQYIMILEFTEVTNFIEVTGLWNKLLDVIWQCGSKKNLGDM